MALTHLRRDFKVKNLAAGKMESYLNRANAVFCALMVSLSVLAIGNVISSYFLMGPISGSIAVKDVYGFSYNYALNVSIA